MVRQNLIKTWISSGHFSMYCHKCCCFSYLGTLAFRGASFGQGVGPIFLDQLACRGDEQRVLDCNSFLGVHMCDHTQDAGIRCIGIYLDCTFTKLLVENNCRGKFL